MEEKMIRKKSKSKKWDTETPRTKTRRRWQKDEQDTWKLENAKKAEFFLNFVSELIEFSRVSTTFPFIPAGRLVKSRNQDTGKFDKKLVISKSH